MICKTPMGNNSMLDVYVNTAISNVRVLRRVPKGSRLLLAENLSDKMKDKAEEFFLKQKKWTQTNQKHELFDERKSSNKCSFTSKTPTPCFKPLFE